MKHYYITNSDFPQGLSCFSSVPHARKYPAGRRNYSERSFGTTLNSKEEENALQDRGPPESGDPGGASLHRRNIMEGRCQYTVFFSAALNLQNIQITDKKLSPISPSFNPCGPCGPQRLPVLHHRGPRRISILAVLADCDKDWQGVFLDTDSISILAVLADRDGIAYLAAADHGEISILAVLADRDAMRSMRSFSVVIFQSSRSLRTATRRPRTISSLALNFNPRGPCGPRLSLRLALVGGLTYFNPRGPCGPRLLGVLVPLFAVIFQSSRSLRTATVGLSLRWLSLI